MDGEVVKGLLFTATENRRGQQKRVGVSQGKVRDLCSPSEEAIRSGFCLTDGNDPFFTMRSGDFRDKENNSAYAKECVLT